jgi:hypothetical protein
MINAMHISGDLETLAKEVFIEFVDSSFYPFLFPKWKRGDILDSSRFSSISLARNADVICKFAGLLLIIYWYSKKGSSVNERANTEVDHIILQVLSGHQLYSTGFALSLLQEASIRDMNNGLAELVTNPSVFVNWRRFFHLKSKSFREQSRLPDDPARYSAFLELIKNLPILKLMKFDGISFVTPDGKIVPPFPFVRFTFERNNPLFLQSFETTSKQPVVVFEDPFGNSLDSVELCNGDDELDQYYFMRQILGLKDVKPGLVYLFGSGYQHIINLAHVISSSPFGVLEELFIRYDMTDSINDKNKSIVNQITYLLAERGPSEIIEFILDKNNLLFEPYLNLMGERGEVDTVKIKEEYNNEIKRKTNSIQSYLDLDKKLKDEVIDRMKSETRCWAVLKAAGMHVDPCSDYVESISMRLDVLKRLSKEYRHSIHENTIETGIKVGKLTERTFRFLLCFYSGIDAYSQSYLDDPSNYIRHESNMITKAKNKYNEIISCTPGRLINLLCSLSDELSQTEAIKTLLDRRYIIHNDTYNKLASSDWIGVLNRLKHDKLSMKPVSRIELTQYVDTAILLFSYLQTGKKKDPNKSDLTIYEIAPIYPIVVSLREAHRKKDGLVIYNYTLHSVDGRSENTTINILTPREYSQASNYYCIPVPSRAMNGWLIDPLIIPCSQFDAIFHNENY